MFGLLLLATVSVTDWGAVCDGFTDDTASVQEAINGSVGQRLTFPAGVCATGPLLLPEKTHLLGPCTLRLRDASDGPLLAAQNVEQITIEGMTLDANGSNQSGQFSCVLRFRHVTGFRLGGSTIRNARIYGV